MATAMLVLREVRKAFKDVVALDGISFEVRRGHVFGYVGPNGAGKTTTLKIIVGLIRSYSGEILVDGERVEPGSMPFDGNLGYLPQDTGFQEWRTVAHALETFGRLSGMTRGEARERIPAVLELVTLEGVEDRRIAHLSGGMRQKLLLAQALMHDPDFLILDEPMAGLDPMSRFQLKEIFKDLARNHGKTIMFSSHILSDVQDIADELAIINAGRVLKTGTPGELREKYRLGNVIELTVAAGRAKGAGSTGTTGSGLLEGLAGEIERLACVESTAIKSSDSIEIHLTAGGDLDAHVHEVLSLLVDARVPIRSFALARPSLERVYLELLRGEEKEEREGVEKGRHRGKEMARK